MENQPFRKQPIYNGNETLFLDMTFFGQFNERDDFLIGFLQYSFISVPLQYSLYTALSS